MRFYYEEEWEEDDEEYEDDDDDYDDDDYDEIIEPNRVFEPGRPANMAEGVFAKLDESLQKALDERGCVDLFASNPRRDIFGRR